MVKAMAVIIAIALIGLGVVYFGGGISSYDPAQRGADARSAVNAGMTWTQIIDAAGEPGKYQTLIKETRKIDGEDVDDFRFSTPIDFDRSLFENEITNKTMPDGFVFNYVFSHQHQFKVHFDAVGTATMIEDQATAADLFDTRK